MACEGKWVACTGSPVRILIRRRRQGRAERLILRTIEAQARIFVYLLFYILYKT